MLWVSGNYLFQPKLNLQVETVREVREAGGERGKEVGRGGRREMATRTHPLARADLREVSGEGDQCVVRRILRHPARRIEKSEVCHLPSLTTEHRQAINTQHCSMRHY